MKSIGVFLGVDSNAGGMFQYAQSILEGFPVVGNDIAFDPYGVTRLW